MAKHVSTISPRSTAPAKTNRKPRANGTGAAKAKRKSVPYGQIFMAMTVIEDALIDMAGSAFLLDQIATHGDSMDDQDRAYVHVARLLIADMVELRAEFDRVHEALGAGTPIERKAMECAL